MGNFFGWTVEKKPDQWRTPFFCLGKQKIFHVSIQKPTSLCEEVTFKLHKASVGGIGNQGAARLISYLFVHQISINSDGSSSSFVNTLYWVTQCICFQFTYSWNLAYNFSSTASVETFIRRGKAVNKSHQSWIWFLARPPAQAIVMQTATWLSGFMH